jgi:putative transcriptional regulator
MLFFKRRTDSHSLQASSHAPIHENEGYLAGQLLVATPQISEPPFHKAVIFLFAHHDDGAMGIVLNQPLEKVHYSALLESEDLAQAGSDCDATVYYGGPVERVRGFVLHSDDYHNEHVIYNHEGISLSANTMLLKDILNGKGPRQHLLAVGYAGWSAGQLEREIEENSWITVPASPELIFSTEDEFKWTTASQSLGIDMHFFSPMAGHA